MFPKVCQTFPQYVHFCVEYVKYLCKCVHTSLVFIDGCPIITIREQFTLKISELDKECNISTLVYSFKLSIVEDSQRALCTVNIFTSDGPGSQELKLQR